MTFPEFESVVKGVYPEAKLFRHGELSRQKIGVAVIFDGSGKVYNYSGTYVEVLNKLNIRACYKHDIECLRDTIAMLKRTNGKKSCFGMVINNDNEIMTRESLLDDLLENCIIC